MNRLFGVMWIKYPSGRFSDEEFIWRHRLVVAQMFKYFSGGILSRCAILRDSQGIPFNIRPY